MATNPDQSFFLKRPLLALFTLFTVFAFLLRVSPLAAQSNTPVRFPSDATVWNVTDYGATGDGTTDDTQAFKNAITAALDHTDRYDAIRIVYVPEGTYLVSESLDAKDLNRVSLWHGWRAGFFMQGEKHSTTIIKLKDNASGFGDSATPKALIRTGSEDPGGASGGGGQAFRHYIRNITVDVGTGNPGAVGIDFLTNNRGGMYNVTVRTQGAGHTGIRMDRSWPGPGVLKNITVEGFQYGISMWNHYQYSMVLEHITLKNQTKYGFRMKNNTVNIRDLTSINTVPAIFTESHQSHLTLIDANLSGGSPSNPAIDNFAMFYGRNIVTSGYSKAIEDRGTNNRDRADGTVAEYWNRGIFKSYADAPAEALKLPVKETPEYHTNDFSQWAKVDGSAADDLPAIQGAIDSGKPIVYLPQGKYKVSNTIVLRGNLKKFVGLCAGISKAAGFPSGQPIIRFNGGSADNIIIRNIRFTDGNLEHNSSQGLALVNSGIQRYYNSASGTGDFFVEDALIKILKIKHPQSVWIRQLNMEFASEPFLTNNGGTVWILGYKTEGKNGTPLYNKNGGKVEMYGGFFYPNDGTPSVPMIINDNATLTANYKVNGGNNYATQVKDIKGGTTQTFTPSDAPNTNNVAIYTSNTATAPPATVSVTGITVSGPTDPTTITTDGGTAQLTANVLPINATNKDVTWSIQGTTLGATVSTTGLVTASGETTGNGTITIRATADDGSGVSDDYDIAISNQVTPPSTHTIAASAGANGSISPSGSVTVTDGDDQTFTITAAAGYQIADVLVDGTSQGAPASYTFTNVTADHTISASFVSSTVPVTGITVSGPTDPTTITTDGGTVQLAAAVSPSNATDASVTWSIQGTTLGATVSNTGLVTASGQTPGNGTITVRATAQDGSGISDDHNITISNQITPPTEVLVSSITITGPTSITTDGGTAQLTANVLPSNATNQDVTWSIQGTTLGATVSASGLVTASGQTPGNGTVTIRATADDGSGVSDDHDVAITNQASGPTPDTEAPSAVTLSADDPTPFSVKLSWSTASDNIGVTEYQVYQANSLIATLSSF